MRSDACWECIEPWPGEWSWSGVDAIARRLGPRWQPVLDYAPLWATPAGRTLPQLRPDTPPPKPYWPGNGEVPAPGSGPSSHEPPADALTFARFAAAFVRRYHPRVVEVWNEPDINVYWNPPDPAAYARLYAAAYRAIKRVRPLTVVLASGLDEGNGTWFIPPMAQALGRIHPDGWSVHPYAQDVGAVRRLLRMDERLLNSHHLLAPFYVTEYGCWSLTRCPAGGAFKRAALPMLAHDRNVVQADWYGNLP